MSKNNAFIIEFFGPPGVGKTTIANELYNKLKVQCKNKVIIDILGLKNLSGTQKKIRKINYVLKYIIKKPKNFFVFFYLIYNTKQRTLKDFVKVLFNHLLIVSQKHFFEKDAMYLLEQGLLQSIWSINLHAKNKVNIEKLLKLDSYNCLVINVKADINTIYKRLKNRKGQNSRIEKNLDSFVHNINILEFEEILLYAQNAKDIKIIDFENNTCLNVGIEELIENIIKNQNLIMETEL